jgi:hypothetical protein
MENERIKIYQGLKADGETDLGFVDFKKKYFGSEQATSNFYQMLVSAQDPKGVFYYNDTIQNFFKKYACDLFPNSTYCGGSGSSTPTANVFSCIEAVHTSGKAYTSGKTQLHITRDGGIKHIFKNDYGFAYKDGDKYQWGTWACVGTNGYKITLRNGQTFSSTDLKWSAVPPKGNTPNQTPPTGGGTETKLNAGDLASGKSVGIGMKGAIVGDIQNLLIKLGYVNVSRDNKADSNFGRRTKKMVEDFQSLNGLVPPDGIVGKDTWAKLNDPAAVKNNSSSSDGSTKTTVAKDGETVAGSDVIIVNEKLKKTLRENLLKFN